MSDAGKTILYLHGAAGPPPADAAFRVALAEKHRLLVPRLAGDATDAVVAELAGSAAHIVAEGEAVPLACRIALDHPALVESLVLSAPGPADAALLPRLGDIKAPCLLLQSSNAPPAQQATMEAYQQRIPRGTRILFYGAPDQPLMALPAWTRLVADFIDRGELFVVNAGA